MLHSKLPSRLLIPPQDPCKGLLLRIKPKLNPRMESIKTIDANTKVAIINELYPQKMESF